MSTVIKVENLSKRYRLGVINRDMLYKDLQSRWAKFRGKEDPNATIGAKHEKRLEHGDEFWALRNVDLEVRDGEILGIIGRNGAGKSTLLKILSQITAPTEGRVKVKGRIASLLEVGTGFHPELTGRENIYLNGAILGMTRKEVRSKFDEIVNFAEISEFIDTPVKRYSSGMYVRLAFAVAAHLEPEILIVDEVLAVGDAEFQKKCLGKMRSVSRQGRTILFVSHNMSAIESLCESAIWFDSGRIQGVSTDVSSIISTYLNTKSDINSKSVWVKPADRRYSKHFEPIAMKVVGKSDKKNEARFNKNDEIFIEITAHIEAPDPALQVGIQLLNSEGSVVYWTFNTDSYSSEDHCTKCSGTMKWRVEIPKGILNVGDYFVEMLAALYFREWLLEPGRDNPSVNFSITGKFSDSPYWMNKRPGILAPVLNWVTNEEG